MTAQPEASEEEYVPTFAAINARLASHGVKLRFIQVHRADPSQPIGNTCDQCGKVRAELLSLGGIGKICSLCFLAGQGVTPLKHEGGS